MSLFKPKERPDIPKDAQKLTGVRLVFSTIWREFFNLLKLNLIFLLSCIGIVTIPAGLTAMSRITNMMVRDENFFVWHEFWKAFKTDFWKSFFGGVIFFVLIVLFSLSLWFYFTIARTTNNWFVLIPAVLSATLLFWVYMASTYFFPMNAHVSLTLKQLLINSFVLVFHAWKRTLIGVVGLLFLWVGIGTLPYSAVYMMFIAFPLVNLLVAFAVYPVIEKRTMIIFEKPEEPEQDTYLKSATFKGWDDDEVSGEKTESENK